MKKPVIVLQWRRFGPYHLARIKAAWNFMQEKNIDVIGMETASQDDVYEWRVEREATQFMRYIVFPGESYQKISAHRIKKGIMSILNEIQPDVIAISGYSEVDSRTCLAWCTKNGRRSILMTESKQDDAYRIYIKELIKSFIIKQFDAVLCGGITHREYAKILGMSEECIFQGYDIVDNDYFWRSSSSAKNNPELYRHLPGLEIDSPFFLVSSRFISRKNIHGLLNAYQLYRKKNMFKNSNIAWRLVILGNGPERNRLEKLILEKNIEGITLAGFRQIDEIPAYYGLASVFIHPALQEQWGLVVNEAMASGLPVLVSRTCGCAKDLVINGNNGFIFNPRDIDTLATLMLHVASGRYDLAAMGMASRKIIDKWTPNTFAKGLFSAFNKVINIPKPRTSIFHKLISNILNL